MKLLVIGCGQCGGRIADEFARLSMKAHKQRGIDFTTGVFAVNTDIADLTGLSHIKANSQRRILIGSQRTAGHGVGKINELGAEVARLDGDKIIDAMRTSEYFNETDAFLVIASAAGGTGSGSIAVLTQQIKERYIEKPVYNIIILPFKHEEITEARTIYNTATCLKSAYLVADAVFLVDNQRFVKKNFSIKENLARINATIVEPFYDLLCAGEEKKPEYIASKILDAGDIMETLAGWSVIGHGSVKVSKFRMPFAEKNDFREKAGGTHGGLQALNEALSELSLKCNPADAKRGLYLLSAPAGEMSVDLVSSLGTTLRSVAPEAIIRTGDYPRAHDSISITVILSELGSVVKVMEYFTRAMDWLSMFKKKEQARDYEHKRIEDAFRDIPSFI